MLPTKLVPVIPPHNVRARYAEGGISEHALPWHGVMREDYGLGQGWRHGKSLLLRAATPGRRMAREALGSRAQVQDDFVAARAVMCFIWHCGHAVLMV